MSIIALVILAVTAVTGEKLNFDTKIVGGTVTPIRRYPHAACMLFRNRHLCGGFIVNDKALVSAAHCFQDRMASASEWGARVGSQNAHSGGKVYKIKKIINHPEYSRRTADNDVTVLLTTTRIKFIRRAVQPATIAGPNYSLADRQRVRAIGWGETETGQASEQLRHVRLQTINQNTCNERYGGRRITANMLCVGSRRGRRDQCFGDSGGPLYHNRVVVGVCSFGSRECDSSKRPGVNARVSRFANWIRENAGDIKIM